METKAWCKREDVLCLGKFRQKQAATCLQVVSRNSSQPPLHSPQSGHLCNNMAATSGRDETERGKKNRKEEEWEDWKLILQDNQLMFCSTSWTHLLYIFCICHCFCFMSFWPWQVPIHLCKKLGHCTWMHNSYRNRILSAFQIQHFFKHQKGCCISTVDG